MPRVRNLKPRVALANTQSVQLHNPDAWREGKTTAERGYGGRWQRARLAYLAKHPLCVACRALGRVEAATVVDHIEPHRGDMVKFWDSASNWQPLCDSCHSAKTANEEGGIGTARRG